ncbi:uncharacterized protein LOC129963216 isoform X2 [Argiope bruennichi]|uniref:uncharacterized protein LOC129963216 isoform X2 n=1 Tax=Argiope bruennichi TaxID=94029 RepID=UPI002494280E|nr:uncharacterized protein LOC129963216 isoform X2 [Argiope bruennichi]
MSGVWFVVSIPTASFERKLTHPDEYKDKKVHREENNRPNGLIQVEINNEENKSRSEENKIVPPTPKTERKEKKDSDDDDEKSLEWHLKDCLEKLAIYDAVWILSKEDTFYQVFFPCEGPGMECDFVLQSIQNRGIGEKGLSTVGIMPCDVFYRDYGEEEEDQGDESDAENGEDQEKKGKGFKAMQKEFLKSVTARLTVAQVVERVKNDGSLSFDFIMFVFIASCIAALGLSENSAIVIVAAMLISPIMGPIMAFTFGITIRDKKLVRMALRTELIGLSICLISGFLFGFICGNFSETWGAGKWPTTEMAGRGMVRSLWSGCLIALPSGAGVAMSVVGGNGASLVGVAISASLLPPTVNCGLLWGLGAIKTVRSLYQNTYVVYDIYNHTVKPALLPPDTYTPTYYPLMDKECAVLGIISFLLTILNIICIIIAALIILKIKEVAPNTTEPAVSRFWKHDVKVARDYNKTLGENEGEDLGKQFLEEWANLNGIDPNTLKNDSEESRLTQLQTLMDIVEDAQEDDVLRTISMSVPAAAEKVNRRLSIAPGMNLQDAGPALRRASIAQSNMMKNNAMKKRRQSRLPNLMDAVKEDEGEGNQSHIPRKSLIYNQTLQNSENPYSMWPSKSRIQEMTRFNVSPVATDGVSPLPNIRSVRSRRRSCHPGQRPSIPSPGHAQAHKKESDGDGKTESTAF